MSAPSDHAITYAGALSLVSRVYHALDAGDGDRLFECFAHDAVWHRPDGPISGEDGIRAIATGRPADRVTAHCVTNLVIAADGDIVTARYYLSVYGAADNVAPHLVCLFDCHDELIVQRDELRVRMKRTKARMKFPG